jgi:signal transduction histidine kinase
MIAVLLSVAGTVFTLKYVYNLPVLSLIFDTDEKLNRLFFYLNFYASYVLYGILLYAALFSSGVFMRSAFLTGAFVLAVLFVYILEDFFVINMFVYTAYLVVVSFSFPVPKNGIIDTVIIILFCVSMCHPSFLGSYSSIGFFQNPKAVEILPAAVYLAFFAGGMVLLRMFIDKYIQAAATVDHLNLVGTKMSTLNNRLQELVRNSSEESVRKDRLRFTRELHDSCGYAFTNIIAITDAAVSSGTLETDDTQDIFTYIRKLAVEGLKEMRNLLHTIREIQEPYMKSIDTIFQLKTIFEEVTDIKVSVEWGNIKHDYGPAVNRVITRIVQEAFTNSVRHGQANNILIQFWEFPAELSMTVTDNGIGASVIVKGIGLAGMEERVSAVGGRLAINSPKEGGFRLFVTIPLVDIKYPL